MPARFNLKNRKEKETLISMVYRKKGVRIVISTQMKIPPKFWSDKRQESKKSYVHADDINKQINKMSTACTETYNYFVVSDSLNIMTTARFKHEFKKKMGWIKQKDLYDYFFSYYEKKRDSPKIKSTSADVYKNLCRDLKEYIDSHKQKDIDFQGIDMTFFNDFVNFLYDKDLSQSTAARRIRTIKTVMTQAESEGIKVNPAYKSKEFHLKETKAYKIYLTTDELDRMYKHDFSDNKKLERSRDLFLIGCWTGLRYGDFSRITKDHVQIMDGKEFIVLTPDKTDKDDLEPVYIPCFSVTKELLGKYNYSPPKVYNQHLNYHLKDIAKAVGINDSITFKENRGGEVHERKALKWELVCTHTARRSFATNMYKNGFNVINIMAITNHSTETNFMKYICVTRAESAQMMANREHLND